MTGPSEKKIINFTQETPEEVGLRLGEPMAMVGLVLAAYVPRSEPDRTRAIEALMEEVSLLEGRLRGRDHNVSWVAQTVRAEKP